MLGEKTEGGGGGGTMEGSRTIEREGERERQQQRLKYHGSVKLIILVPRLSLSEGLRIMSVGKPEGNISFMGLGSR